ncbi:unnamed protein product [Cuscuta epithymum]|uniref:Uncharacterized protein n=1 Tax=Cuscuta epithymum TaxID=186058 RepID=A0AAV0FR32_9ASTE|nr:unnamed protein product [Cuscuta epithymum]CAH9138079.1 unnamed protein product [Cuscuta epithymum]
MGKGIMRAFGASKTKMQINVDPSIGRPKDGEESAKPSSQIGIVTRDLLLVPRRWNEVDQKNGPKPGFDHPRRWNEVDQENGLKPGFDHIKSLQELSGDSCDRIEFYKRTHYSEKKGWSSKVAEEN